MTTLFSLQAICTTGFSVASFYTVFILTTFPFRWHQHWNTKVVMMTSSLPLTAIEVVITTILDNAVILTAFLFQWSNYQDYPCGSMKVCFSVTGGDLDFEDLNLKSGYTPFRAYCRSKLANVLFTTELHRRMQGTRWVTFISELKHDTRVIYTCIHMCYCVWHVYGFWTWFATLKRNVAEIFVTGCTGCCQFHCKQW